MADTPPIDDDARPRPAPGFQTDVLDGEAILFQATTLEILHLNPTATLIWSLCDGQRCVADLRDLLCAAYPGAAAQIPADLVRTLRAFQESGALIFETGACAETAGAD